MTAATFDAALAAVRNVGDGPRLLEQANRIADGLEARIGTARKYVEALPCRCLAGPVLAQICDRCQALGILGGEV
jgi:hypothetical protein